VRGTVASLLVSGLLAHAAPAFAQADAGPLATWRDGELRESYDQSARETRVFVAVMPSGPQGTPTVVLSARWPGRVPEKPLNEFEVRVEAGLGVNPNFLRKATLSFILDRDTPELRAVELSDRLRLSVPGPGVAINSGIATMTLLELIQLLQARTVRGVILGIPVELTLSQIEALRRFGDRVLAPAP
jgi:hypothetical protein